jgi:hypothetical protein
MKFKIGDHLQEIDTPYHGLVTDFSDTKKTWYLIESDEMELVNHWVPESNLELHKQTLREFKLNSLGI